MRVGSGRCVCYGRPRWWSGDHVRSGRLGVDLQVGWTGLVRGQEAGGPRRASSRQPVAVHDGGAHDGSGGRGCVRGGDEGPVVVLPETIPPNPAGEPSRGVGTEDAQTGGTPPPVVPPTTGLEGTTTSTTALPDATSTSTTTDVPATTVTTTTTTTTTTATTTTTVRSAPLGGRRAVRSIRLRSLPRSATTSSMQPWPTTSWCPPPTGGGTRRSRSGISSPATTGPRSRSGVREVA